MNNKKKKVVAVAMTTLLCTTTIQPIMAQESTILTLQQGTPEKEVYPDIEVTPTDNSLLRDSAPTETSVEDVEINKTNFPDEAFRNHLNGLFQGSDGKFTSEEIANIKTINLQDNTAVKELKGIEHFTALENLNCSNTGITSLDVSKNTVLRWLICQNTGITSLDVSKNTALEMLYCSNTSITDLNVSNNRYLNTLNCSNTSITDLNVSKNMYLTDLDCFFTGITSLNVSNNTSLTRLRCDNNKGLESLIVDGATSLTKLICFGTGILSLSLSNNTSLTYLDCSNTSITDLNVSNNKALTQLYCYENLGLKSLKVEGANSLGVLACYDTGITKLDVSKNVALENLGCFNTKITKLDVSNNKALKFLHCYDTGIKSLDVSKNTVLTGLFCSNTPLAYLNIGTNNSLETLVMPSTPTIVNLYITEDNFNIEEKFPGIDVSKISKVGNATFDNITGIMTRENKDKAITYTYDCGMFKGAKQEIAVTLNTDVLEINEENFPDEEFRGYLKSLPSGRDGKFTSGEIAGITTINVSSTSVIDLTGIEYFTALSSLQLYNTEITRLDVSNNTSLTVLSCYNTRITSLDVSKNTALEYLSCNQNSSLKNLKVDGAAALETLSCYNTGITSLDVSNNTSLAKLDCSNTDITSLDVSKNTALKRLDCDLNSSLKNLKVDGATALMELDCSNTGITSLDVSNNTSMGTLVCFKNVSLNSLKVDGATALIELDCSNTGITSLDVSKNTALKGLNCDLNSSLKNLKVDGATALETLSCSNTGITSLDVSNNVELVGLDCANTPLAYLNIGTNNNLKLMKVDFTSVNLNITEDTFNIKEKFPGIDLGKIEVTSGEDYDKTTGVISNFKIGTPITYTYDCGTSFEGPEKINVTLNLTDPRGDSALSITDSLSKSYDGNAVSATPTVSKSGSTGAVSYKWEKKVNDTEWKEMKSLPIDVGTYRVTATLAPDNDYKGIVSSPVEFTISEASNSLTKPLSIKGWTYGKLANEPSATTTFGSVTYLYCYSKDGIYSRIVPTDAGTWYVKVMVEGTDNYESFESAPVSFVVAPMNVLENSQITVPDITADTDIDKLVIKDGYKVLEQGTDYNVTKIQDDKKTTVTVIFKGNYTGTITKTYTEAEKVPSGGDKDNDHNKPEEKEDVPTGDYTQTGLLTTISLLSIGCITFLTGKKRKKN